MSADKNMRTRQVEGDKGSRMRQVEGDKDGGWQQEKAKGGK